MVNNILEIYDKLSEDDKIRLFLSLDARDMRNHYDPSYKQYRIKAKNVYGLYIVDVRLTKGFGNNQGFYNEREAHKRAIQSLYERGMVKYIKEREKGMTEHQLIEYRNTAYVEYTLTQE
jgi:hypothetical protein